MLRSRRQSLGSDSLPDSDAPLFKRPRFWIGWTTRGRDDSGGANRTTTTTGWHWSGKATVTTDAMGRQITTTMDPDGMVTLVRHTNATPVKTLLDYSYGTSGVENGQLLQASDMPSNMKQSFTYVQTGPAKGQVLTATDANALVGGLGTQHIAQVTYGYDATTGERASSRLQTWAAGQQVWNGVRYEDYKTVGLESPSRAYTQLVRQQLTGSTWADTDDQYWYSLDPDGRLLYADFAARRRGTQAYTDIGEHNAGSFARATYGYDAGGRLTEIVYRWIRDDGTGLNGAPNYVPALVRAYASGYDDWGKKTFNAAYVYDNGTPVETYREAYEYDPHFDQLSKTTKTGTYGGGPSVADYAYDAAGNRTGTGWTYDGLNRILTRPGGGTYQHDVLGNRTYKDYGQSTVTRYQWDELGRMRGWSGGQTTAPLWGFTARYRPDGMRAQKVNGLQLGVTYTEENEVSGYFDSWATDKPTTRYYYDGQTPFAEDYLYKDAQGVDRQRTSVYVPGLRGCDGMRVSVDGTETAVGWPIYDTHGNNVGMFEQTANDNHTVGHERRYDAWGGLVWQTGDPPMQGYCANIGHRKEPESELIYMRARCYEPSTGRFISEDPAMDGTNWYAYCRNAPTLFNDPSGQAASAVLSAFLWFVASFILDGIPARDPYHKAALQVLQNLCRTQGAVEVVMALAATSDAKARAAKIGVCIGVAVVSTLLAIRQLILLYLMGFAELGDSLALRDQAKASIEGDEWTLFLLSLGKGMSAWPDY